MATIISNPKDTMTARKGGKTSIRLRSILQENLEQGIDAWVDAPMTPKQRAKDLATLSRQELCSFTAQFGTEAMARVLQKATPYEGLIAVISMKPTDAGAVLQHLSPYYIADGIRSLEETERALVLGSLPGETRMMVASLLRWEADTAGGNMTPSFLMLSAHTRSDEALNQLSTLARDVEASSYIYLVDVEGMLTGVVSFRGIVTAEKETPLSDISTAVLQTVTPETDREIAAQIIQENDLMALPVVQNGRLLGVITADRAAEIMDTETTEDFHRMSSAGSLTESIKSASVWMLYRSRVAWLVILVFGNIFSGAGIAYYEELIESVVALVFFLPLLIDSGGNAGSQSATLMVRAIATGDVVLKDWFKVLGKEIMVAALLGLTMAAAVSVLGAVRGGPEIALVVAVTMVVVVIIGSVIGMSLPFLLSKIGLDPANASAPLITSICDGTGVLMYFFIASQFLL